MNIQDPPELSRRRLTMGRIDITVISNRLGNTIITITARYLDHIAPRAVIETMRGRVWTTA